MDEFEEWFKQWIKQWATENNVPGWDSITFAHDAAEQSWLESAHRADRKAREECCAIVRSERVANECACEADDAYNFALTHAERAIRATIKEE